MGECASYYGIAEDAYNSNTIYAYGNIRDSGTGENISVLNVSYDTGVSWVTRVISAPGSGWTTSCYGLAASKSNGAVYVTGYDYDGSTIFPWIKHTDNGGLTFNDISGDLATQGVRYLTSVWASPSDAGYLVVGTSSSSECTFYITSNGGATWNPANTYPPHELITPSSFKYNPGTGVLYSAVQDNGIWESSDGGMNWNDLISEAIYSRLLDKDLKNGYLYSSSSTTGIRRMSITTDCYIDVKCNAQDGGVIVNSGDAATVRVCLSAGPLMDIDHDVWVLAKNSASGGKYSYGSTGHWSKGWNTVYLSDSLPNIREIVLDRSIPVGSYKIYFGIDSEPNGLLHKPDVTEYDIVDFDVVP